MFHLRIDEEIRFCVFPYCHFSLMIQSIWYVLDYRKCRKADFAQCPAQQWCTGLWAVAMYRHSSIYAVYLGTQKNAEEKTA